VYFGSKLDTFIFNVTQTSYDTYHIKVRGVCDRDRFIQEKFSIITDAVDVLDRLKLIKIRSV
jgi:hypothetical protein